MADFSPELIDRMKKRFAARHGVLLSDEKAEEYLNAWADLVLAAGRRTPSGAAPAA